jgi:hypothetical protein
MFCEYSNIFGEPGQGIHSIRLFNIAIVDVIATIIVAYPISEYFSIDYTITLISLFVCGIVLHRLFCVRTIVDKLLFE